MPWSDLRIKFVEFAVQNWQWFLVSTLFLLLTMGWIYNRHRYKKILHESRAAIKLLRAEVLEKEIDSKRKLVDISLQTERDKDEINVRRIESLNKESRKLELLHQNVLKKRTQIKAELNGKTIEEIDRIIKSELE